MSRFGVSVSVVGFVRGNVVGEVVISRRDLVRRGIRDGRRRDTPGFLACHDGCVTGLDETADRLFYVVVARYLRDGVGCRVQALLREHLNDLVFGRVPGGK